MTSYSYDAPPPERIPIPTADKTKPYAEVRKVDDKNWIVVIIHGVAQYGPGGYGWRVRGSREKAERKAQKELANYMAQQNVQQERFIVTLES